MPSQVLQFAPTRLDPRTDVTMRRTMHALEADVRILAVHQPDALKALAEAASALSAKYKTPS